MTANEHEPAASPVPLRAWQGSNEQLLEMLRERHPDAAAILFDRFESHVNRLVWHLLGADADHDDLVQGTFLNAMRAAHRLRAGDDLRGWVCTIAINLVRSELRRRRVRRVMVQAPEAIAAQVACTGDPKLALLVSRAFVLLDRLPAPERIAFVLRCVEERPLAEAAMLMRCSLATAKRRVASAEKKMRAMAADDSMLHEYHRTSEVRP